MLEVPLTSTKTLTQSPIYNVVFLHEKFGHNKEDFYLVDIAAALQRYGHRVSIYTSKYSDVDISNGIYKVSLVIVNVYYTCKVTK